MGIGATLSTTVAGWIADRYGDPAAFVTLALAGLAGVALVWLAMPETRPTKRVAGQRRVLQDRAVVNTRSCVVFSRRE